MTAFYCGVEILLVSIPFDSLHLLLVSQGLLLQIAGELGWRVERLVLRLRAFTDHQYKLHARLALLKNECNLKYNKLNDLNADDDNDDDTADFSLNGPKHYVTV